MSLYHKNKKIIIVTAHPDDAEYGMGMRIRKHVEEHDLVSLVVATAGEYKDCPKRRYKEAEKAIKVLGINSHKFLNYKCGELNKFAKELRKNLEDYFVKNNPDIVYTIYPLDIHADHNVVSQQAFIAARSVPTLIYFRVAYGAKFSPNLFFFGNNGLMQTKIKALKCYYQEIARKGALNLEVMQELAQYEYYLYFHHRAINKIRQQNKITPKQPLFFEPFCLERGALI